jgi:hypothetical protein
MNAELRELFGEQQFCEFEYRLLYLRPNRYSEEQLVVGLVASEAERLEARFVSTASAIALLTRFFGEEGVEQFQFASAELRRAVGGINDLQHFESPSDLIIAGERFAAVTRDRDGLLKQILSSASSLMRAPVSSSIDTEKSPATRFARALEDRVQNLNPLVAENLFRRKVTVGSGEVVDLPIYGRRIFGASVSLDGRDHHIRAEAYVAKFSWLKGELPQAPRVYLHCPPGAMQNEQASVAAYLREVSAIAGACNVPLVKADSLDELAAAILKDEAA